MLRESLRPIPSAARYTQQALIAPNPAAASSLAGPGQAVSQAGAGNWPWFADYSPSSQARLGFRTEPGGVHLSKTMMLHSLAAVMNASPVEAEVRHAVIIGNVLQKPTGAARRLTLAHLNALFGILTPLPIQSVALRLWARNDAGRPVLAMLCALAREPLLRATAPAVLEAANGSCVRWPDFAALADATYPARYSPKMLKSLSQNCASSWTQSGHLKGKVDKRRAIAQPSAECAAFAALLATLAGFGGPALLQSPWMRVLDRSDTEMLSLLRRAEAIGLARVRAGGGVLQIRVRRPMAEVLGVDGLGDD